MDWVVPHQASGPGLELLPRLGFRADRIVNIVGQYGNCVAASLPMALAHVAATGRLHRGQRVAAAGARRGTQRGRRPSALVSDPSSYARFRPGLTSRGIRNSLFDMRTTLDLPEPLVEEARRALGFKSKTDTVVVSLQELVRRKRLEELKGLLGQVRLEIDIPASRRRPRRRRR